jgi:hypothetical protein
MATPPPPASRKPASPNKKGQLSFEPVETVGEGQKLLEDCARTTAMAQIFSRTQKVVFNAKLSQLKKDEGHMAFKPDGTVDPEAFIADLKASGSEDSYVSLTNDRTRLFFKTSFVKYAADRLVLRIPKDIFRVQRREFLRYKVPASMSWRVQVISEELPEVPLSVKILDLSAGGLGLSIDPNEAPLFQGGTKLTQIELVVGKHRILCGGVVRHLRESMVQGRKLHVVGVLFDPITETERQWINQFVFDRHRALLSKFL